MPYDRSRNVTYGFMIGASLLCVGFRPIKGDSTLRRLWAAKRTVSLKQKGYAYPTMMQRREKDESICNRSHGEKAPRRKKNDAGRSG